MRIGSVLPSFDVWTDLSVPSYIISAAGECFFSQPAFSCSCIDFNIIQTHTLSLSPSLPPSTRKGAYNPTHISLNVAPSPVCKIKPQRLTLITKTLATGPYPVAAVSTLFFSRYYCSTLLLYSSRKVEPTCVCIEVHTTCEQQPRTCCGVYHLRLRLRLQSSYLF